MPCKGPLTVIEIDMKIIEQDILPQKTDFGVFIKIIRPSDSTLDQIIL